MKAIVVGAGIAGLVAARQLALAGWDVEVLEKSRAPRPDGYMMDFFGPGVEASERIGLYSRLAKAAYHIQSADYVDTEGRTTCSIDYLRFSKLAGGKVLSLLRPDMETAALAALEDVAGRVRVRYGARVVNARTDGDGAHVVVEDGQEMSGDALIGADGIHSEVRAGVFGPERDYLRPLGMRAAAFIVTDPALNARFRDRFILTDTLNRMAGLYGIRQDEVAAFLVYRDAVSPGQEAVTARQRLRNEFAGLGDAVDRLLDLCPAHPYDDTVAQVVMPRWHTDRTVLVGDACGAVSLLAGQGGSLAIAGAALLGDVLGPVTTPSGIGAALARFEQQWRPAVELAQKSGRRTAATFLPRNSTQRLLRRWVIRATRLPGVDRLVAHQILRSIAK
ncbi:2-polyprenyl-6-methoxyphenol hydroxylase-like FAD-dependent oxidoreductase [Pseudarthrobacter defluvii]|uniref:FAD-dependent oxidoreductase n=1 Tax=Pseudarthrobacter defluvii TaxID=410837 RepID=UPI00277F92F2|nr:FAD-dependent oxidoreductase [Pseudarthrobacter defluvii]MDQ0768045.1 2-polyprenyl-6-methoxyphenol hydroxylase-like FAD-dependent oxidoreductase [Pseudarthrobacter defluvii]